jgi:putative acetyltransferase
MKILLERPDQSDVAVLIDELDAYQKPLYPPESHHGIDMAALLQPNVIFAVVRADVGAAIGCGAVVLNPDHGELKRMYLRPEHRGRGLAQALLEFLESQAAARGCRCYALETGIHQLAAIALYERAGYVRCAPFGGYAPDPLSVFMRKELGAARSM